MQPIAYNRIIPIGSPASYNTGQLSVFDDGAGASSNYSAAIRTVNGQPGVPCLVVEMSALSGGTWFWNIRVGEEIQINNAGPWYTIVGPMTQLNPEGFINIGPPGTALPTLLSGSPSEYLLLVNKRDDGATCRLGSHRASARANVPDGWVDSGWDGVDNNGDGIVDDAGEWEQEQWLGNL